MISISMFDLTISDLTCDPTPQFVRISDSMCETEEGLNQVINLMTLEELSVFIQHVKLHFCFLLNSRID